jgi:dolichol-phosphate mannosyltransferase
VYNEAESLPAFYSQLCAAADRLGESYEIIFVNDGSTDDSLGLIRRLKETDDRVRYVDLSRNFGQQEALTAGYDYATGQAVISLDADCQHPPGLIGELVARWRQGYEVVYTVRINTRRLPLLKRLGARLFYWCFRALSGLDVADQADFRLLDRKVVEALRCVRENARFLRGLVSWMGFRQAAVPYQAEPRHAGKSGYSLGKMLRLAAAAIFNFSLAPLRLVGWVGLLMLAVALAYLVVALVLWPFLGTSLAANVCMLAVGLVGVQLGAVGILGEYLGRAFEQAKGRPIYIVREAVGFEPVQVEDLAAKHRIRKPPPPPEPTRIRLFT